MVAAQVGRLRCQSYQAKVEGHWPDGSSWQTGHFASAIWKFLWDLLYVRTRKPDLKAFARRRGQVSFADNVQRSTLNVQH
jgi:hypothetical protein